MNRKSSSIDFIHGPEVKLTVIQHDINEWQALRPAADQVALWWLGQAGFALRCGRLAFLIDPFPIGFPGKKV